MSYDVSLEVNPGTNHSARVFDANYTANLEAAWRHAGVDLAAMDSWPATAVREAVGPAIARIHADRAAYEPFEPANGWGSIEGMLRFLRRIHRACLTYPHATVHVSH